MDWNYLLAIPSFTVGLLAGFQGIYERYDEAPFRGALSLPGLLYLLTRGVIPVAVYLALYGSRLFPHPLWFWSLLCGTAGTELILRAKIFIKEERSADGGSRELMYGPFNLLRWYQNLFLESIRKYLPTYRGEWVRECVSKTLKDGMTFNEMYGRVKNNLYYYDRVPKIQQPIIQDMDKYFGQYEAKNQAGEMTEELDIVFQYKLGYSIIRHTRGERGLKLLLS